MFDGDKVCNICNREIPEKQRKFGRTLSGQTYVFCNSCFYNRKDEIRKILHEDDG